jgi:hypothetical protein
MAVPPTKVKTQPTTVECVANQRRSMEVDAFWARRATVAHRATTPSGSRWHSQPVREVNDDGESGGPGSYYASGSAGLFSRP